MDIYLLLFFTIHVFCGVGAVGDEYMEITSDELTEQNQTIVMHGTFQQTIKRYHCRANSDQNQRPLLYGTKAWMFPPQDVNLTLVYPPTNQSVTEEDYILTELQVLLYMEGGVSTKGYVTGGGMLQTNLRITFIMPHITRLSYQFWVYGVAKNDIRGPLKMTPRPTPQFGC